jgi:hypothetical protein
MAAHLPPGWPGAVRPHGTPGFEPSAVQWLLDLCPPDYRGYPVLQRHPLALAWLAGQHVGGARQASARALATARAQLGDDLGPGAMQHLLAVIEQEQARLMAAARALTLVEQALRGHRYVPRL